MVKNNNSFWQDFMIISKELFGFLARFHKANPFVVFVGGAGGVGVGEREREKQKRNPGTARYA